MKRGNLLLVAVLAAVVVAALLWFVLGGPGDGATEAPPPLDAGAAQPAPALDTPPAGGVTAPAREAAPEEEPVAKPTASSDPAARPPDRGYLTGRVVDENGRPVAAADVSVSFLATREFSMLDLTLKETERVVGEQSTGSDGTFRIQVPAARGLHLTVERGGFGDGRVQPVYAGEEHLVVLRAGCVLEGRVVLASDGSPVADVSLRGFARGLRADVFEGRSGPDGRFRFDDLPAGVVTLEVEPADLASREWMTFELVSGEVLEKLVELDRGIALHGRITDAATGAPIADAEIWEGWFGRKRVRTDVGGEYRLAGFGGPGVYDVHVHAKGYGATQHEFAYTDMPKEDFQLDFKLVPAHRARGRVVDPAGAPIEGAYVAAVDSTHDGNIQRTDWIAARTDAEGRYELDSLHPELKHTLFVQKTGYATVLYNFPPAEAETRELVLEDVVLPPPARVEGVVVDENDVVLPGIDVTLSGWNADYRRFSGDVSWGLDQGITKSYVGRRVTKTDSLGRFQMADVPAGSYKLICRAPESSNKSETAVDVAQGSWVRGLRVVYSRGLSISGHVVTEDGYGLANFLVRTAKGAHDFGRSVTTGQGGSFTLSGLEPGRCTLVADPTFFDYGEGEERFAWTELEGVEAGSDGVRIVVPEAQRIAGVVRDADGEPWPRAFVWVKNQHGRQVAWKTCDEEGRFAAWVGPDSVVTLTAAGTRDDPDSPFGVESIGSGADGVEQSGVRAPAQGVELVLPIVRP